MAHEIEIDEATGRAAFVGREIAWHRLGTTLDRSFTAAEALEHAHLAGWDVRKTELFTHVDGEELVVPRNYATVRNNPFTGKPEVLGSVGEHYHPVQNEAHLDLLDALVDQGGANFETAGSLKGGKEVFVTMKVPSSIQIGGHDPVDTYISALNSHDGSTSFKFIVTPVRIVCANTQAAALKAASATFRIRHTINGTRGAIAAAREALDITFAYLDEFEIEAQKMIEASYTEGEFSRIVSRLYPIADDASQLVESRQKAHRANVLDLFTSSDTNTEIRGTRWAGYQAVTEYLDHFVEIKGKGLGDELLDARALNVVSGASDTMKEEAFRLLTVK